MKPRKIRKITPRVYGIAISNEIALMNENVQFTIKQSGTSIILESGCSLKPTKEEIELYDYADSRIN